MTECPAIACAITQKTRMNSELSLLCTGKNGKLDFFYDTWNPMERTVLSSEFSLFAVYPKTITRNLTFKFNLENIVPLCLISSQTHSVDKNFSSSVKD